METPDHFCRQYEEHLDGTYDCVDRIVINAYFILAQSPAGFRTWWRSLTGDDSTLDNTHLMRLAGRFSRRIHAYAKEKNIPVIHCHHEDEERKHQIAEGLIPKDPNSRGVFCILSGRAPAPVYEVRQFSNGAMDIRKKTPQPWVNHYYIHIIDPDWGHVTIRFCPHPPFNAQVILNGHEYVAIQARRRKIRFIKEGNCFTHVSDPAGLAKIADTMRDPRSVGQLLQVCQHWIYSTSLCFALETAQQQESGFWYSYSVYQAEYSRNLLFTRGRTMDQIFQGVIDRIRAPLNIKTARTIFGYKHRPYKKNRHGKRPRFEVVVERPTYDLTIFKMHFGNLTVKIYSKGERVLRIEAIAHNARDLRCGRTIEKFPQVIESVKAILERFVEVLHSVDAPFIDAGTMEAWSLPSQVGACRVGGIDINRPRTRAMMEAVIALSPQPRGFTTSEAAAKVREIIRNTHYESRHASYDLKKLRGKALVSRLNHSRRYQPRPEGLRAMTALIILRDKALVPLLAGAAKCQTAPKPPDRSQIDIHYDNIQIEMQKLFQCLNIAA